jgi:hypothetical protein
MEGVLSWGIYVGQDQMKHVVPVEDMRPHRHSINCWCRPIHDQIDGAVIVHNAMDEREKAEEAVKQ